MSRNVKVGATVIATLVILVGVLAAIKYFQISSGMAAMQATQAEATPVQIAPVEQQVWPRKLSAVGTLEAFQGLLLSAEISGRVSAIHFESGQYVQAGQLLLEQESGNEQAQLRAAQARLKLAQNNLQRLQSLRERQSVSQSALDEAAQQVESAQGDVDNLQTTLSKKRIVAPFSGRLGIREVYLGQDLQVGTDVVSLQAIEQLRVNFNVPQQWLNDIKAGYPVVVTTRQGEEVEGEIFASAAEIDPMTRNLKIQAIIDNDQGVLLPGMSVDVVVKLPNPDNVIAIPTTAVLYATYGDTVFVVEPDEAGDGLVVRQQFVRLGKAMGDYVSVEAGLEPGQKIVSAGAFKLYNGMPVRQSENDTPELSLDPNPVDS